MEHTKYPRTTDIERKSYTVDIDNRYRGSRAKIVEETKDRSYTLSLQWSSIKWISESIYGLLNVSLNHKFFKETRIDDYSLWVEKTTNRRGYLAEITKLNSNGKINKLVIPMGEDRWGWALFYTLLQGSKPPLIPTTTRVIETLTEKTEVTHPAVKRKVDTFNAATTLARPQTYKNALINSTSRHGPTERKVMLQKTEVLGKRSSKTLNPKKTEPIYRPKGALTTKKETSISTTFHLKEWVDPSIFIYRPHSSTITEDPFFAAEKEANFLIGTGGGKSPATNRTFAHSPAIVLSHEQTDTADCQFFSRNMSLFVPRTGPMVNSSVFSGPPVPTLDLTVSSKAPNPSSSLTTGIITKGPTVTRGPTLSTSPNNLTRSLSVNFLPEPTSLLTKPNQPITINHKQSFFFPGTKHSTNSINIASSEAECFLSTPYPSSPSSPQPFST